MFLLRHRVIKEARANEFYVVYDRRGDFMHWASQDVLLPFVDVHVGVFIY